MSNLPNVQDLQRQIDKLNLDIKVSGLIEVYGLSTLLFSVKRICLIISTIKLEKARNETDIALSQLWMRISEIEEKLAKRAKLFGL